MKVYFAHPTSMYDTPVERELQKRFEASRPGVSVENPNQPQHSQGYQAGGMDYFVGLCNELDGVFFAPFANGKLGAGVAKEVNSFLERDAPVYEFDRKTNGFREVHSLGQFSIMSVDETRAAIRHERADSPYDDLFEYSACCASAAASLRRLPEICQEQISGTSASVAGSRSPIPDGQ